jgi:hypothetical protein
MKRFLALYIGTEATLEKSGWNRLGDHERAARQARGIQAWMDWGTKNVPVIVDQGTPLGKTMRASPTGISNFRNNVTGYVIVEAETHEQAAALFRDHPHFTIFPGDSVEIMECLPLPAQ